MLELFPAEGVPPGRLQLRLTIGSPGAKTDWSVKMNGFPSHRESVVKNAETAPELTVVVCVEVAVQPFE